MQSSDEAEIEQRHRRVGHTYQAHGTWHTRHMFQSFSIFLFAFHRFSFFYLLSAFILLTLFDCALRKQFANCLKRRNESQNEGAG